MTNKLITLACRRYFEDRLIFFLDCKYFNKTELSPEETKLIDESIMRSAVELKGYDFAIEMMTKEGYDITIEERRFNPEDILGSIADMKVTDVVEDVSTEETSIDEEQV